MKLDFCPEDFTKIIPIAAQLAAQNKLMQETLGALPINNQRKTQRNTNSNSIKMW